MLVENKGGASTKEGVSFPKPGDTVTVHYTGTLTNGKMFDSSYDRGKPFVTKIGVGLIIKGLDEGLLKVRVHMFTRKMSLFEKAKLTISPDYGYGSVGVLGVISPNATLIYEVELLEIK